MTQPRATSNAALGDAALRRTARRACRTAGEARPARAPRPAGRRVSGSPVGMVEPVPRQGSRGPEVGPPERAPARREPASAPRGLGSADHRGAAPSGRARVREAPRVGSCWDRPCASSSRSCPTDCNPRASPLARERRAEMRARAYSSRTAPRKVTAPSCSMDRLTLRASLRRASTVITKPSTLSEIMFTSALSSTGGESTTM